MNVASFCLQLLKLMSKLSLSILSRGRGEQYLRSHGLRRLEDIEIAAFLCQAEMVCVKLSGYKPLP